MVTLDSEYLQSLKDLEPAVLTDIINKHTDVILATALGMGWNIGEAEELVQETFVTFLSAVRNFQGRSAVRTYLIGILYKKTLERRREIVREQPIDPIDEVFDQRFGWYGIWKRFPKGPDQEAANNELALLIQECAGGLTTAQRMAFYLKEVEKSSTDHICNVLNVTSTHLGVLMFRARNKLRECIEKKWSYGSKIS